MMHRVPEARLADGEPDVPFMLSWANEPWTGNWDGVGKDNVLLAQEYGGPDEWHKHFDYLQRFWSHPKHIRVEGGRPLFAIYRTGHFPGDNLTHMLSVWKGRAAQLDVKPPFVVFTVGNFWRTDEGSQMKSAGLDGAIHFWPTILATGFFNQGSLASTHDVEVGTGLQYWGAYFGFDRRVRARDSKKYHWSPVEVLRGLQHSFSEMRHFSRPSPNLVFLTAFNEWNEQAVPEPDDTHGYGMLHALKLALRSVPVRVVLSPSTSDTATILILSPERACQFGVRAVGPQTQGSMSACCARTCGPFCGGAQCQHRPGGGQLCCRKRILQNQVPCTNESSVGCVFG